MTWIDLVAVDADDVRQTLQHFACLNGVLQRPAALLGLGHGDIGGDQEVLATGLLDGAAHVHDEAHPVFQTAAVLVLALIGQRAQEAGVADDNAVDAEALEQQRLIHRQLGGILQYFLGIGLGVMLAEHLAEGVTHDVHTEHAVGYVVELRSLAGLEGGADGHGQVEHQRRKA